MASRNRIIIFIENKSPQSYDLDSFQTGCVRLGRGPIHGEAGSEKNDIAIPQDVSIISRAHCTFYKTAEGWHICDDKSVNGLIFNGVKIKAQQLHDGDKFYVGKEVGARCVIAFSSQRVGAVNKKEAELEKFALAGRPRVILGRGGDCDIVLSHPTVSRHHSIITCENGEYYIADNNSTNGLSLNGALLRKKRKLEQMDKVTIADTSMVFCDGFLYFQKNIGGVSVVGKEITKMVKSGKKEKCIQDHVNLSIEPGEFVAIIGGSGAGKTTLLNCLSGMTDFTSGDVLINGESIKTNSKSIRSMIGYVPQDDIVYNNLTLERMLYYSAQLRMPKDTSKKEIAQKIDETLQMVELEAHRNTLISKLSGGQRKRASIAVELLASPKLFFLDEPSSGLDPGTEKHLMEMLKKITLTGKTVIMVTHTVQNIHMCDRVVCMGNGGLLCFSGTPQNALSFFGKKSMTDVYDDLNEHSKELSKKNEVFVNQTEHSASQKNMGKGEKKKKNDKKLGFLTSLYQFKVMTQRYAEIMINSRSRLLLLLVMPVILTVLVCIAFQADGNLYNYLGMSVTRTCFPFFVHKDTTGIVFAFSCAGFWVGIFNSIQEISKERAIYEREQFTGIRSLSYVMSKFVVNSLLCIVQSAIMLGLFTFFTNTTVTVNGDMDAVTAFSISMGENAVVFTGGGLWLEMYLTTLLALLSAMCLGLAVSAAVSNDMALVICPVCLLPQILFAGVVTKLSGITETISNFVVSRWMCIAYFTSVNINSKYSECKYNTGNWEKTPLIETLIDQTYSSDNTLLFGLNPVYSTWLVLFLMLAACLAIAVVILYIRKLKKSGRLTAGNFIFFTK